MWQAIHQQLTHELRLFLIALQFLTRVPVPAWVGWREDWMNQSARHFPLVGAFVGAFGAAVFWGAAHLWSATMAVLMSMVATVWLTGAFHEDGLADTCDGLGGAVSRQRALEIMKDSRLGTYGTVGLLAVLALKAVALTGLAVRDLNAAYRARPALWSRDFTPDGFEWLVGDDADQNVAAFLRIGSNNEVLACVANFSPVPRPGYRLGLPTEGTWREVLNTDAEIYGGSGVGNLGHCHSVPVASQGRFQSLSLRLPPLGILILEPLEDKA